MSRGRRGLSKSQHVKLGRECVKVRPITAYLLPRKTTGAGHPSKEAPVMQPFQQTTLSHVSLSSSSSSPSSSPSPCASPSLPPLPYSFSHTEELEALLLSRGIPFQHEAGAHSTVHLFTQIQTTLADSFIQQLDWVGVACNKLHLLLENMQLSTSSTRMPPAAMLSHLWNATTNLKVVAQRLDSETLMRFSCFLQSLLSLHPPGQSSTADAQYSKFLQGLGGGRDQSVFAAWLHIKHLLSVPGYKYFYRHLSFLVDLLLSDYWAHTSQSRPGRPWFVSVFWPSSGSAHISLPVRQLLECILQQLVDYRGSEVELSVLQSSMALLFLVSTHCSDLQLELSRLARKLPKERFLLFLSQLRPTSLQALVATHCPLNQACPSLAVVLHTLQNIQLPLPSGSRPSNVLPPVAIPLTDSHVSVPTMSNCDLPQINKLHITSCSPSPALEQTVPPHTESPTLPAYPQARPISSAVPANSPSAAKRPRYSSAPTPLTHSPLRVWNSPKSLSLKKSQGRRVVYSAEGSMQACKRRAMSTLGDVVTGENAGYRSSVKRQRLSCENCQAGVTHFCHCSE